MFRPDTLRKKLKLLIMLRLLVATLFLCFGLVLIEQDLILFTLIVTILALSILYVLWLTLSKHLYQLAAVQISLDIVIETVLMSFTGGFDSVFSVLVVLTIFSAGIMLKPRDGFLTSIIASMVFILMLIAQHRPSDFDLLYAGYISYVKISIFLLVGFLSSAMARQFNVMEQELRLMERLSLLGETTAQLAHELRNPLMSITGALQLISKHIMTILPSEDQRLLQTVQTESTRLNNLLEQMLNYTHDEKYEFEQIRLRELLDEVLLVASQHPSRDRKVDIVKPYRQKNYKVEVDRNKMKQVFINIIQNSFQAMPGGGKLIIGCTHPKKAIEIFFSDTGRGMDKEAQKRIFQPFSSSKNGGTGIGLALAQKIVRQHGGRITFTTSEGEGTTFHVFLPSIE